MPDDRPRRLELRLIERGWPPEPSEGRAQEMGIEHYDDPTDLTTLALTDAEADIMLALAQYGIDLADASPQDEVMGWAGRQLRRIADKLKRCP